MILLEALHRTQSVLAVLMALNRRGYTATEIFKISIDEIAEEGIPTILVGGVPGLRRIAERERMKCGEIHMEDCPDIPLFKAYVGSTQLIDCNPFGVLIERMKEEAAPGVTSTEGSGAE